MLVTPYRTGKTAVWFRKLGVPLKDAGAADGDGMKSQRIWAASINTPCLLPDAGLLSLTNR